MGSQSQIPVREQERETEVQVRARKVCWGGIEAPPALPTGTPRLLSAPARTWVWKVCVGTHECL